MTHTNTEALSDAKLNEMLAGLEGVTPGPWQIGRMGDETLAHVVDFGPPPKSPYMIVRPGTPANPSMGGFTGFSDGGVIHSDDDTSPANAAHIARCDPDTIRYLVTQELSRRSASNTGGVEVKSEMHRAASALLNTLWQTVYSGTKTFEENWAEMDRRFPQARWLQEELKASHSLAAEAEPVAQGSCASCNGTGDTGGNPSYGMCPDCDGTGKFPPAPSHSSSVSAEMTESPWRSMDTAPLDGKHCILAVPEPSGFIYSVQGAYQDGQWNAVHRDNVQPLYWMPNILLPKKPDTSINGGRENG